MIRVKLYSIILVSLFSVTVSNSYADTDIDDLRSSLEEASDNTAQYTDEHRDLSLRIFKGEEGLDIKLREVERLLTQATMEKADFQRRYDKRVAQNHLTKKQEEKKAKATSQLDRIEQSSGGTVYQALDGKKYIQIKGNLIKEGKYKDQQIWLLKDSNTNEQFVFLNNQFLSLKQPSTAETKTATPTPTPTPTKIAKTNNSPIGPAVSTDPCKEEKELIDSLASEIESTKISLSPSKFDQQSIATIRNEYNKKSVEVNLYEVIRDIHIDVLKSSNKEAAKEDLDLFKEYFSKGNLRDLFKSCEKKQASKLINSTCLKLTTYQREKPNASDEENNVMLAQVVALIERFQAFYKENEKVEDKEKTIKNYNKTFNESEYVKKALSAQEELEKTLNSEPRSSALSSIRNFIYVSTMNKPSCYTSSTANCKELKGTPLKTNSPLFQSLSQLSIKSYLNIKNPNIRGNLLKACYHIAENMLTNTKLSSYCQKFMTSLPPAAKKVKKVSAEPHGPPAGELPPNPPKLENAPETKVNLPSTVVNNGKWPQNQSKANSDSTNEEIMLTFKRRGQISRFVRERMKLINSQKLLRKSDGYKMVTKKNTIIRDGLKKSLPKILGSWAQFGMQYQNNERRIDYNTQFGFANKHRAYQGMYFNQMYQEWWTNYQSNYSVLNPPLQYGFSATANINTGFSF